MAIPRSLRAFALAAVLTVTAASAALAAPFLANYVASSIPFNSASGGGQVATTATGQTVVARPEPNHSAPAPVVPHDMRAWGFGHFLPDLWEVRTVPCTGSCSGGPTRSAPESGEGSLGRPSVAS